MIIVESKIGETVIIGSGVPPTRLAPNFNGISQYADVGNIIYSGDYTREVSFIMPNLAGTPLRAWGRDGNFSSRFLIDDDGSANVRFSDNDLSGFNLPSGTFVVGETYKIIVERVGSDAVVNVNDATFNFSNVDQGDSTFNYIQRMNGLLGTGVVYDYLDSLGNNFPMDDGWQNNPTMRNTGSGSDGTFVNMTEAAWQEITP